jgi:D-alanyl-D-alanine carboxypeptidase
VRWRVVLVAVALGLAAAACGQRSDTPPPVAAQPAPAQPAAAPLPSGLPPTVIEQLQDLVAYPSAQLGVPGTITLVDVDGVGTWTSAIGRTRAGEGSPAMSADDTFGIGSITKTFTATAVLRLIAIGASGLTLERTLASFSSVPTVPNADEITVAELLQHTSGIADYAGSTEFICTVLQPGGTGCDPYPFAPATDYAPATLVEIAATMPPQGEPGAGWHYSNTNYVILGMIIEELTGQPAETVITEEVIEPLDLEHTTFPTSIDAAEAVLTTGPTYAVQEPGQAPQVAEYPVFNPSAYWTAGAIISTAEDLAVWVHALAEGALLPLDLQLQRLRTVPAITVTPLPGFPGEPIDAGYGLGIAAFGDFLGHNGAVPGFETLAVYDPYSRTTIVMVLNAWVIFDPLPAPDELTIPTSLLPSFISILDSGFLPPTQ